MDKWVLDADGQPVPEPDLERWGAFMGDGDKRRVAWTEVGKWRVSTVFLGLDHAFGEGSPVLWETMVFGPEPWDGAHWRYTSAGEARANHDQVAEHIRRGGAPDELD